MALKVLIADDEALIRADLRELLEGLGYSVCGEAADGAEVLSRVEQAAPDVIILDIRMPNVDGIEVSRILARDIPIIMLTAHSSPDFVHAARDAGVMAYLTKPFREQDIEPAVELAVTHFLREAQLSDKVERLQQQLQDRKVMERAKALLCEHEKITEAQAYRKIQKVSMNKNVTQSRVAELIIELYTGN